MTLTFQRERMADLIPEITPLLLPHWREVALDQDTIPLEVDWPWYLALEGAGILAVCTARDGTALVGYVIHLVSNKHLHYKSLRFAECDAFYLAPAHRKGLAGLQMFRASDEILRDLGVKKIINKMKLHFDPRGDGTGLAPLFARLGYRPIETVYAKTL